MEIEGDVRLVVQCTDVLIRGEIEFVEVFLMFGFLLVPTIGLCLVICTESFLVGLEHFLTFVKDQTAVFVLCLLKVGVHHLTELLFGEVLTVNTLAGNQCHQTITILLGDNTDRFHYTIV